MKCHLWFGYSFWTFCLILYQSPWYHYASTGAALILEEALIFFGAWIFWIMGLPNKAGETFLSEYSLIIGLRWMIVLVFQFQLLIEIFRLFLSMLELVVYFLRRLAFLASDVKKIRTRNDDGTFAPNHRKPVGRPRKS